jgi:hypothetical protein
MFLVPPVQSAIPAIDFLNSIGANSSVARRGETLAKTIECVNYVGIRWIRSGPEGGQAVADCVELHRRTGAKLSWSQLSGDIPIETLTSTARQLAAAGALLAFEGPNEPNNWGITYKGESGGRDKSWGPVANLQRDMYQAVKSDPTLAKYPVWGISENGAETDNVGLQFLTVPTGAKTLVPDGTRYADFANVHNYIYHPNSPGLEDNKTWNAADPTSACRVDGLYGEYGLTWGRHFKGYSAAQLPTLPRVTTETGCAIDGPITEEIHALNLLSLYLDQFKRGWSYTAVYLLRDRVDEAGNQRFGFFKPDYSPRKAAVYLHNLTTILADKTAPTHTGRLRYSIPDQPATVHDMLLQKSDGRFELVVWSELLRGSQSVTVELGGRHSMNIYDPTLGVSPVRTFEGSSVKLEMTDHPVVLEMRS